MKLQSFPLSSVLPFIVSAGALLGGCMGFSPASAEKDARAAAPTATAAPSSDPKLVARYDALADEIIDTRRREVEVVRNILVATYRDAEEALASARAALRSNNTGTARPAVEHLATLVGCLATEGDASGEASSTTRR
jgi:hypothetical protein